MELVLYRHYSDEFAYASISSISEVLNELIYEGLITILRQPNPPKADVVISERGRQALSELGSAAIISTLCEVGKKHLLDLCNDALTLGDLPILLASGNEQIRTLARRIYREWT